MTERNGDGSPPHKTATVLPPVGKPFTPGHDPRRNPGGRPRGLASLVRQAVGDGEDLVDFMAAVFKGDTKTLGVRAVPLRDRLQAAAWFADRGWGKAVTVVELPDEPAGSFARAAGTLREMPEDLKQQIRQWLESRRAEYLAAERTGAEARMRSYLPPQQPDGNGGGPR